MKYQRAFLATFFAIGNFFLAVSASLEPSIHDVSKDFSIASNPNGVWSYGWKSTFSNDFNLFTLSPKS